MIPILKIRKQKLRKLNMTSGNPWQKSGELQARLIKTVVATNYLNSSRYSVFSLGGEAQDFFKIYSIFKSLRHSNFSKINR